MKKLSLALLPVYLCLAAPVGALTIVDGGGPVGFEPDAWAAPMKQAFIQIGTNRLSSLGVDSLVGLSQILHDGGLIYHDSFARLAEQAAHAVSPQEFAAMGEDAKIALIRQAALAAQAKANAEADEALAAMPRRWNEKIASDLWTKLAGLSADGAYLSPDRREKVRAAKGVFTAFKEAREEAFAAWVRDTPRKIYDGAFAGAALIAKGDDGWLIGEHKPTEQASYQTYAAAFAARQAEIEALPEGPWKKQAAAELVANIGDAGVARQAQEEGADVASLRAQADRLKQEIGDFGYRTGDKKADAALNAYLSYDQNPTYSRKPGTKEAIALLRHYDAVVNSQSTSILSIGLAGAWRMEAALLKGDPDSGFRSYDELTAIRDAAISKAHDSYFRGLFGYIASALAFALAAGTHAPRLAVVIVIAFIVGSIALMAGNIRRKASLADIDGPGRVAGRELEEFRAGILKSRDAMKAP